MTTIPSDLDLPRVASVPLTPGVASLSEDALRDVWWGCHKRGWNPDGLVAFISSESGWDPTAENPSGATGIGQIIPVTAKALGTTTAELKRMSVREQLPYVFKYFDRAARGRVIPVLDFKVLGFSTKFPPGQPDETVLYEAGSAAAKANAPYADPKTGAMTVGSVRAKHAMYLTAYPARRAFETSRATGRAEAGSEHGYGIRAEPEPKRGGWWLLGVPIAILIAAFARRKHG